MATLYPFAIVGGGIIGLSIALALKENQIDVLLIEKNEIGSGASSGNAGHLATEQVFPVADISVLKKIPRMLVDPLGPLRLDYRYLLPLMPWAVKLLGNMRPKKAHLIHQHLVQLNAAALPAWQAFSKKWGIEQWLVLNGSLLLAETESSVKQLQKHGEYLNSIGIENTWLNQQTLFDKEPALTDKQLGALYYPLTGHITDLDALHKQLKKSLIALGGKVAEHTTVNTIKKINKTLIQIDCQHTVIHANNVVLSCGAYAKPFAKMLSGINVPLETERGYHLMLPNEKNTLSIPVTSADRRFIMTPMNGGLRLAGTVEYAGLRLPANMNRARNFIPLAQPMLRHPLHTQHATEWMGFRPTLSDSLPVIDKQDNCYFAFGHQHLGLTHAAITADAILAMHLHQPPPIDCSAFSINRFK